jgi:hypothetical protein
MLNMSELAAVVSSAVLQYLASIVSDDVGLELIDGTLKYVLAYIIRQCD